jgi:hypothetical protein
MFPVLYCTVLYCTVLYCTVILLKNTRLVSSYSGLENSSEDHFYVLWDLNSELAQYLNGQFLLEPGI